MSLEASLFCYGALAMASFVAGLFFLRYFVSTRDRLFIFLSLAFCVFSLNWVARAFLVPSEEHRYYHFVGRLFAFVLIIIGIIDKNRRERPRA